MPNLNYTCEYCNTSGTYDEVCKCEEKCKEKEARICRHCSTLYPTPEEAESCRNECKLEEEKAKKAKEELGKLSQEIEEISNRITADRKLLAEKKKKYHNIAYGAETESIKTTKFFTKSLNELLEDLFPSGFKL